MIAPPARFDPCGPLPTGTTLIEASAGTGKTFTLAALAARYLAEGVAPVEQLLIVTFGRAATQELRERVRRRLVSLAAGLAAPGRYPDDELVRLLCDGPDPDVRQRARRVGTALASFDAATIATTHVFCRQMLAGLGEVDDLAAAPLADAELDDLALEVTTDLYVRKYADPARPAGPVLPFTTAMTVARAALADPHARLEPAAPGPAGAAAEPLWAHRWRLATAVRAEVDARKRRRGLLAFDDVLVRLRTVLDDPQRAEWARQRLRQRFSVVLVDEFQDTDPVQWDIVRLAFAGKATVVLIGDPKQAIYAFRGADVATYLGAARQADRRETLSVNWRSDAGLTAAVGALFGGSALGERDIAVRPVTAAHTTARLAGAGPPLRVRAVPRSGLRSSRAGTAVGPTRKRVAADLAAEVVRALSGAAVLDADRGGTGSRSLRPGDLAVLVRTHVQGALVRDALTAAGVPVVLGGGSSVFATAAAREWLVLLDALDQPHRGGRARAAALTSFLGWPAERLAADTADPESARVLDDLGMLLGGWADLVRTAGVAALFETLAVGQRLPERLLRHDGGERLLTDLRHVAEILHAATATGEVGTAALAQWLRQRIADAGEDNREERSRRLETDAEAVQVLTVHRSKGSEFPVVYVPFGWDRHVPDRPDPLRLHDEHGRRVLDVGGPDGPDHAERLHRHRQEEAGEDLRLLYVACTRARCQLVLWWAPAGTARGAPLHRLLFGGHAVGESPPEFVAVPGEKQARVGLQAFVDRAGGHAVVEDVAPGLPTPWTPPASPAVPLDAARFARSLDRAWRRTSYSALTAAGHDPSPTQAGVSSEPEQAERGDEPAGPPVPAASEVPERFPAEPPAEPLRDVPSPMADLPTGTAFGTVVHAVLEAADAAAEDLPAELRRCAEAALTRRSTAVRDADALAAGLLPALRTPLGVLAGGRRLCDVPRADRLTEVAFELPLLGGDTPSGQATLSSVAALLRAHLAPADSLADYPDLLAGPATGGERLRGYLTGSVDALLRLPADDGPRYVVVDYKTNWLGPDPAVEPLSAWHYRPAALRAAMLRAHYPLQALLYSVAVHRFLRWRQRDYDPNRHLGGVLYLFLRGMCGADTPVVDGSPCGVFGWRPPAELVTGLADLLDVGASAGQAR